MRNIVIGWSSLFKNAFYRFRGNFLAICFISILIVRIVTREPVLLSGLWLVITGWIIRLWSGMYIGIHTNSLEPSGNRLARNGLYNYSRNPMYIGNIIICLGILIYGNCMNPWVSFIYMVLIFYYSNKAVTQEEHYLLVRFNEDAELYFNKTPRWIGLDSFKKSHNWFIETSIIQVLKYQYINILKSAAALVILAVL